MPKVKKKHSGPINIQFVPPEPGNLPTQESNSSQTPSPNSEEVDAERILAVFFAVVDRTRKELESYARKLGELQEGDAFPEHRAKELREKIVSGVFDWAVTQMGSNLERYLNEGSKNFLDHFELHYVNPYRTEPRTRYDRFWGPFEKARFFISLKPGRRIVHHSEWPKAWEIYRDTLPILQEIKRKTRGSKKAYLLALKERLPGVPDDEAEKIWSKGKPSDAAAEYVRWKLKILTVGVEALKEYFRVFHQPYGYWDFIARNLNRQK